MMLLNVVSYSAEQAREIIVYLLDNKFISQATIGRRNCVNSINSMN